jgi:very-short-patch-repair endonuclease
MTNRMIRYRVATERWARVHPGVYALAGAPPSWRQDVWAAILAAGPRSVASHETALLLHGLDDRLVPRHPLRVVVPHGAHPRLTGAVVHQLDDLEPHHVVDVDGLPATTPARAVVDLAARLGPRRLGDLVDVATRRTTSSARIARCTAELARRGKPGIVRLGAVLDARGPGYVPPASVLEAALFRALADGALPAPARQFRLPGRGALDGLVDAAYADVRLILEADGRRWHTRIRELRRDHQRDAEAARAGWQTLRLLYEDVVGHPDEVAATVRDVRAVRSAQLAGRTA